MTARCGSFDPTHRAKTCRTCQAIYRDRTRHGGPRFRFRLLARGARCEFCEITSGNSRGIAVYRYTLRRAVAVDGKRTSRALGSLGICDICIVERNLVSERGKERMAA